MKFVLDQERGRADMSIDASRDRTRGTQRRTTHKTPSRPSLVRPSHVPPATVSRPQRTSCPSPSSEAERQAAVEVGRWRNSSRLLARRLRRRGERIRR